MKPWSQSIGLMATLLSQSPQTYHSASHCRRLAPNIWVHAAFVRPHLWLRRQWYFRHRIPPAMMR